jgi:hypothetical protein
MLVAQAGEQRQLLGPVRSPFGGHVGLMVPVQDGLARTEQRDGLDPPNQSVVGVLRHSQHALPPGLTQQSTRLAESTNLPPAKQVHCCASPPNPTDTAPK